jgi:hypothetical protein
MEATKLAISEGMNKQSVVYSGILFILEKDENTSYWHK